MGKKRREGGRKGGREGEKEGGREKRREGEKQEDADMTTAKNEENETTGQRVTKEKQRLNGWEQGVNKLDVVAERYSENVNNHCFLLFVF